MSPQRSNRDQLVEGTLRCLEQLPPERVTARAIADESGANLASIAYHFGSKDELVTTAVLEGLDRWLVEVEQGLATVQSDTSAARYRGAADVIESTRRRHAGLAQMFFTAVARAPHDPRVRAQLAAGFHRTRPVIAELFGLGDDQAGHDAAGLALAQFYGLLLQLSLDPTLAVDGPRLDDANRRMLRLLPTAADEDAR
ncbi:TetR/AcrR family transcriptional regulator [Mycolicibacterium boenickei]